MEYTKNPIGGFPELVLSDDDMYAQRMLCEDVVDKVIKRDVLSLFNIRSPLLIEKHFCQYDWKLYRCVGDVYLIYLARTMLSWNFAGMNLPELVMHFDYETFWWFWNYGAWHQSTNYEDTCYCLFCICLVKQRLRGKT